MKPKVINPKETTTVYKLVDGRYMDRTNTVYIYDGKDTWTDTNGVEWKQEVKNVSWRGSKNKC